MSTSDYNDLCVPLIAAAAKGTNRTQTAALGGVDKNKYVFKVMPYHDY